MDHTDQIAVVTGGSRGIGLWTALGLAQRGMVVVITGRDRGRCLDAQEWLWAHEPKAHIEAMQADFSLVKEVRALAARLRRRFDHIDILINNAGMVARRRQETAEGNETSFAVNYLAPFALTLELLPVLRRASAARIVNVSSASADKAALMLDDLQSRRQGMLRAYGQSKLALQSFSFELARRLARTSVTVNALHPGMVATEIGYVGGVTELLWRLLRPVQRSPESGAEEIIHAACAPELAGVTGQYLKNQTSVQANPQAYDPHRAARLWETSLALTGLEDILTAPGIADFP